MGAASSKGKGLTHMFQYSFQKHTFPSNIFGAPFQYSIDNEGLTISGSTSKSKGSGNGQSADNAFVEGFVCDEADIGENEMKTFDMPDGAGKVLIVKQDGVIHALGSKCTHYKAPLEKGVLGNGHVRCPWHGACFNLTSGDIEDFPGLDSLPTFQVSTEGGRVKVRAQKESLKSSKVTKCMVKSSATDTRTFVVIGGGAAGACAVETLRQEGFTGRQVLITSEPWLPYDRIKLSKALNSEASKLLLRSKAFYDEHAIEVKTGTTVSSINVSEKELKLSNGESIRYSKVLIASGSRAVVPSMPGSDLNNIFTLRTVEDANTISDALTPESDVVVVGSSFIGMEVAAYCVGKSKSVTVVGRGSVPFEPVLGAVVGARTKELFEEKGVKFVLGTSVAKFTGDGTKITEAHLENGTVLPVDVCLVGIGSRPNTDFLAGSNVNLERGAIVVDKHMSSSIPDIYAAGDVAYAPVYAAGDKSASIGHWQLAHYHGHVAAKNMVGNQTDLKSVPFFWTMLFGVGIRYAGYGAGFDDVVITGDVSTFKFIAHYCVGDTVVAVATAGSDPAAAKFAERLLERSPLLKEEVKKNGSAWVEEPL